MSQCEDCKKSFDQNNLALRVRACAGINCCYKNVCSKGCVVSCNNGHQSIMVYHDCSKVQCPSCDDVFVSKILWYGNSAAEQDRRDGCGDYPDIETHNIPFIWNSEKHNYEPPDDYRGIAGACIQCGDVWYLRDGKCYNC